MACPPENAGCSMWASDALGTAAPGSSWDSRLLSPSTQVKQLVPIITCQGGNCGPWTLDQGRWLRARPGCGQLGHQSGPAEVWRRDKPLGSPGCWRAQLRRRPGCSEGHPVRVLLPTCCTTWGWSPWPSLSFPTEQARTRTLQGPLREGFVHLPVCCPVLFVHLDENHVQISHDVRQALTLSHPRNTRLSPCLRGQRDSPSCSGWPHAQASACLLPRLLATLPGHWEASAGRMLTGRQSRVEQEEGPGDNSACGPEIGTLPNCTRTGHQMEEGAPGCL